MKDPREIIKAVCDDYNVDEADLKSSKRDDWLVEARHTCAKLMVHFNPQRSQNVIASWINRERTFLNELFNNKDIPPQYYFLRASLDRKGSIELAKIIGFLEKDVVDKDKEIKSLKKELKKYSQAFKQ